MNISTSLLLLVDSLRTVGAIDVRVSLSTHAMTIDDEEQAGKRITEEGKLIVIVYLFYRPAFGTGSSSRCWIFRLPALEPVSRRSFPVSRPSLIRLFPSAHLPL